MAWLENAVNTTTDWDWGWGPLVAYRPPKHERMGTVCYVIYGLAFPFSALLIIVAIAAFWSFHTPAAAPPSLSLFVSLCWWAARTYFLKLCLALLIAVPFAVLIFVCWNRRADRLNREGGVLAGFIPETGAGTETPCGVWPPAPKRPR